MGNLAYAVPLNHGDSKEYVRLRRDLERVGSMGMCVAYEFPNTEETRRFFTEVIGSSQSRLETSIVEFLKKMNANDSFVENIVCNWTELDNAKHSGLVAKVLPIDIDHEISDSTARGEHFMLRLSREARLGEMLYDAIMSNAPFNKIVQITKADMLANRDAMKIRNMEMKKQVKELVRSFQGDVVFMAGVDHIRWMEKNLGRDHVHVKELDKPEDVAGVWWVNYLALEEANRLEHKNLAGINIAKLAVMLSIRTLRAYRGGKDLSDLDIKAVQRIITPENAKAEYERAQIYYKEEFLASLPILVRA